MTKTRHKIINLGQQLVLGTIREHFYSRALCISLAYFNNPSEINVDLSLQLELKQNVNQILASLTLMF